VDKGLEDTKESEESGVMLSNAGEGCSVRWHVLEGIERLIEKPKFWKDKPEVVKIQIEQARRRHQNLVHQTPQDMRCIHGWCKDWSNNNLLINIIS
jgi:hypothetical protein